VLEGSSGDTRAEDIRGRWTSEFSSGDLELTGFRGEEIRFKTSSGDVRGNEIQANRVESDTSSGDVSLRRADVEDFSAESSSGDVRLEVEGGRLQAVRAHTSSGDVTLGLPRDASFEADADQSSGDMSVGFTDGSSTLRHDKVVAYRRGEGATRIRVETSSGDLVDLPELSERIPALRCREGRGPGRGDNPMRRSGRRRRFPTPRRSEEARRSTGESTSTEPPLRSEILRGRPIRRCRCRRSLAGSVVPASGETTKRVFTSFLRHRDPIRAGIVMRAKERSSRGAGALSARRGACAALCRA
jgi:hypothetical protein